MIYEVRSQKPIYVFQIHFVKYLIKKFLRNLFIFYDRHVKSYEVCFNLTVFNLNKLNFINWAPYRDLTVC